MAESKTNRERKGKVEAFKEHAKEQAKQQAIPKTHLVPLTEWPSTENLDLRGDLMDALEQQMVATYQNLQQARQMVNDATVEFQKAAHVMQMIIQQNIKAGKISLKYQWNNGEDATADEVTAYETEMNKLRELQKKQYEAAQQEQENLKKNANAQKTGLVSADGSPLGTTQDLDATDTSDGQPDEAVVDSTVAE